MHPDRAATLTRIIATAAARQSSDFDGFCALLAVRATDAELETLADLLPVLAGYPAYANGRRALHEFETQGVAPPLSMAVPHIGSLVARARRAATEMHALDDFETQPAAWVGQSAATRPLPLGA